MQWQFFLDRIGKTCLFVMLDGVLHAIHALFDDTSGGGHVNSFIACAFFAKDISFIKNFVLASGSLKEMAKHYGVTYPTVRLRLDKLIQKITISDNYAEEPYVALIKRMAVNDKLDFDTAKVLISEYKKSRKGRQL